jgi:acetamidase/formamidase
VRKPIVCFVPTEEHLCWTFGGQEPLTEVEPVSILEDFTEDCVVDDVRSKINLTSEVCKLPFVNPQTGPVFIKDAEVGDTIAANFIAIKPANDWVTSTTARLFGTLSSAHLTATLQDILPKIVWTWKLD